jgi:urease accessory protein
MINAATALILATLCAATPAEAHIFGAGGAGFLQGLEHPLLGVDHVLAMVAVGVWASQLGRPAWWILPVVFPAAMVAGGLLGWLNAPVPAVELGIALSILILGCLIGLSVKPDLRVSVPLVAAFAIFHGYAHGVELPETASPVAYGGGFTLATAFLHVSGLAIGWLGRNMWTMVYRVTGAALAMGGIGFLLA